MSDVSVSVSLPKETYELGAGLAKFVSSCRQAAQDGWQTHQDLPVLISSAIRDLIPALEGYDKVKGEAMKDPVGVAKAAIITLGEVLK